ncbi:MAG: S41 family peptidase [Planctomycetota bacterium]
MRVKRVVAPLLLVALSGELLVRLPMAIADRTSVYEWFDPIIEIRHILVNEFVESPDETVMQTAMIDGMIETLEDPYTLFVPPRREADFNKELRGTYVGIGAEVNIEEGQLTIVSPMDDSPALEAGILAGDIVLEIEGQPTLGVAIDDCIDLLMGEPGTPVSVRVRHLDEREEDIVIVRRQIVTRTVKGLRRTGEEWNFCIDEDRNLAYVRVTQFNSTTAGEFREVMDALLADGLEGLVLDLRDNPGGALRTAVAVADMFVASGDIVSVRDRRGQGPTYTARDEGVLPDFPTVVIVNGHSASASEIVAGALQDHDRAVVLGTRTYGKGSVQEVRELEYDRGTLKFTSAFYYLPGGRSIQKRPRSGDDPATWGVDPDPGFVVPMSDEAYVNRIRVRREFEIIRAAAVENGCADAAWIREHLMDDQLALAVESLQARVDGGEWDEVSEVDSGRIALEEEIRRVRQWRESAIEQIARMDDRLAELQGAAAAATPVATLLPEDVDLTDGVLTVRDREGTVIGSFRIEGGDVAAALGEIRLEKIE